MNPVFEVYLAGGTCDIVGVQFSDRIGRRIPSIKQLVSVELKMDDVAGVLHQCSNNRNRVSECWAAMPADRINRMRKSTVDKFIEAGVGLLSISEKVEQICVPKENKVDSSRMIKKLWRRRDEWKSRIDSQKFKRSRRHGLITQCY